MDEKSEEELERIANLVTAEMIRNLNAPKSPTTEHDPDGETDEDAKTSEED